MKMMSSTRTTSTKGTTLISDSALVPRKRPRREPLPEVPIENAMLPLESSFGQVQEFELKILHARAKLFDRIAEQVVENGSRNGRSETQRGGDRCLGNSRRDRPQAGSTRSPELLEGINDAPHGPE